MNYCVTGLVKYSAPLFYGLIVGTHMVFPSFTKKLMEGEAPSGQVTQRVRDLVPEVFEKHPNLRDDILLFTKPVRDQTEASAACAAGSQISPHAVILIDSDLLAEEPALARCFIKHEICHIASSDGIISDSLNILISTVVVVALSCIFSYFAVFQPGEIQNPRMLQEGILDEQTTDAIVSGIFGWVISFIANELLTNTHAECRADKFAMDNSTIEELVAGQQYFAACAKRLGFWDLKFSNTHPISKDRADAFAVVIKERNVDVNTPELDELRVRVIQFEKKLALKMSC